MFQISRQPPADLLRWWLFLCLYETPVVLPFLEGECPHEPLNIHVLLEDGIYPVYTERLSIRDNTFAERLEGTLALHKTLDKVPSLFSCLTPNHNVLMLRSRKGQRHLSYSPRVERQRNSGCQCVKPLLCSERACHIVRIAIMF